MILPAVLVASLAILFNISGSELVLRRDLDTNQELRDAGFVNLISGGIGGFKRTTRSVSQRSRIG